MNAAKNENAAALGRERLDDAFDLPQRFAGVELGFDIILATEQFEIGDRFEADDFVPACRVDHQIACDGEEIGAPCRDIFPVVGGIGPSQDFGDHILQLVGAGEDAAQATAKGSFLRKNDGFEPF